RGRSAAALRGAVPGGQRGPNSWLPDLNVAQLELEPRPVLPDVDRRDECDRYPARFRLDRTGQMSHPEPDTVDFSAVLPEAHLEVVPADDHGRRRQANVIRHEERLGISDPERR